MQLLPAPWLEIVDPTDGDHLFEFGPAPALGTEFDVDVNIATLSRYWYMVLYQTRITYDPTLLEVVDVTEGPFLTHLTWNKYGTIFGSVDYPGGTPPPQAFPPHVMTFGFLLPNGTGVYDQTIFPYTGSPLKADPTLYTIRFRIITQDVDCDLYCTNRTAPFGIMPFWWGWPEPDKWFMDRNGDVIGGDWSKMENGTYYIHGSAQVGRVIDVYTQYPAPFGGQGPNQWSDMFWPQKEVILCANVTYNCWPTQAKIVNFIVYDTWGDVWTVLEGITDEDGVACASFRIPWPCPSYMDPERLFGVWTVVADVDLACEVINDTLWFHYDYLINIIDVDTDKYYYAHCEDVEITVTFTSYARQTYEARIWVVIHDELNVPIAIAYKNVTIEGAEICQVRRYVEEFTLHIEKFAFAGYAIVHAIPKFFWGGYWTAAGPELTAEIYILPEWV